MSAIYVYVQSTLTVCCVGTVGHMTLKLISKCF